VLRVTKVDQSRSKSILSREKKMDKSDKATPQTLKQRQATLKAKRRANGYVEIATWVKTETNDRLNEQAKEQGITKGELLDYLVIKSV
jgi:hypothetical protein